MDELTARQLVRQLKIINFWITFFGVTFLITFAIFGVLIFKVVTFMRTTEQKISDFQVKTSQTLDVKDDLCKSGPLSGTSYCKNQ